MPQRSLRGTVLTYILHLHIKLQSVTQSMLHFKIYWYLWLHSIHITMKIFMYRCLDSPCNTNSAWTSSLLWAKQFCKLYRLL